MHQYSSGDPIDGGQARIPLLKGGQAGMGMAMGGEAETNVLRFQVSVQILIPLIFYSYQFILLIFHSCMHLQSAGVCCDCCDVVTV